MEFEWDDLKNKSNVRKHHIRFEDALYVFLDPLRIERFDTENSAEEERWQTIGKVGKVLFVVYTERNNNRRIISAGIANREERSAYYGNSKNDDTGWAKADR